jgi:hypothetical protein
MERDIMSAKKQKPKTDVKASKASKEKQGYGSHLEGSRKGKVHELFDKQGAEAAWTLGLKLGLKQGTLRSWFGQWRRESEKATPAPRSQKKPAEKKGRGGEIVPADAEPTSGR